MKWTSPEIVTYINTITSVSQLWRKIALSVSKLWTSIVYDCGADSYPKERKIAFERMRWYLARSKSSPIDVQMCFAGCDAPVQALIRILHANALRLRDVILIFDSAAEHGPRLFPLPPPLHHLRSLHIVANESVTPNPEDSVPLFQQDGVPKFLKKLTFDGMGRWETSNLPVHLLKSITLSTRLHRGDIVDLLPKCTNAKTITLSCLTERNVALYRGPIREMPHVVSIDIEDNVPVTFHRFLSCPNLESLKLTAFHGRGSAWAVSPRGVQSLPPKWPRLTLLELSQQNLLSDTLKPLLQTNPTITHLTISHLSGVQCLLDLLLLSGDEGSGTPGEAKDSLLPCLEYLTSNYGGRNVSSQSFGMTIMEIMKRRPKLRVRTWAGEWAKSDVGCKVAEAEYGDRLEVFEGKFDWLNQ